jgi:molybdate transport system regulatory protein
MRRSLPKSSAVGRLVVDHGGRRGKDRMELLEKIAELGSISGAAKAMHMSYKAAWEAVEALNNLSKAPLVARTTGGRHGGGTVLTAHGLEVVSAFRRVEATYQRLLEALGEEAEDFHRFYQLAGNLVMKTSARNQFFGQVKAVLKGPVSAEVILDLGAGDEIVAVITNESLDTLALKPGSDAFALVKAPWVIVTREEGASKTSARNRLCGVVVRCQLGTVNGEVVIELAGGKTVAAVLTSESIRELGLEEGVRACALIKASHVILAVAG